MADASPGFLSNLVGGVGSMFGFGPPDPNAQQKGETDADYATRRQNTRFGVMKQEVDGLLKKYPPTGDFPADSLSDERRGLRQRGFDQKEEDAIINTFAGEHGTRRGNLDAVLGRPGGEEWEKQFFGEAKGGGVLGGTDEPGPKKGSPMRDDQVLQRLYDNWNKAGERGSGYSIGKDKRGRTRIIPDPDVGFKT